MVQRLCNTSQSPVPETPEKSKSYEHLTIINNKKNIQGDSYVWNRLATIDIRGSQPGVKGMPNLSGKPFFS